MRTNPAFHPDFYKMDHRRQYTPNTELVFSNWTARGSRLPGINATILFGPQYFVKEYLIKQWNEEFFNRPKEEVLAKYKRRIETSLGPGAITYEHIEALHDLGYLPLHIMALPEGSFVPLRCASLIMFNTLPEFFWLTNYFETILSTTLWGPCTSATMASIYRKTLNEYADKTVGNRDFVQWQGHDFSERGMFGHEAACMSGAAHLLLFTGTDTISAIEFLEQYYCADAEKELIGGSVPATEHSVMCMGLKDGELETFKRLITEIYPKGPLSIVSDTWDYWSVITDYTVRLKGEIMAREGKIIFRPDSSRKTPVEVICGYKVINEKKDVLLRDLPGFLTEEKDEFGFKEFMEVNCEEYVYLKEGKYYEINSIFEDGMYEYYLGDRVPECEVKGSIQCLWDVFGGTITEKGYKLLDSHVGLIYGDSITWERNENILRRLEEKGFCSFNIVEGIGSYTYQYTTRDTHMFAVKATYGEVAGEGRNIFKTPKTDDGTKNSAKGLLAVYKDAEGNFFMKQECTWDEVNNCEFKTIFKDGKLYNEQTLSEIRERIKEHLK